MVNAYIDILIIIVFIVIFVGVILIIMMVVQGHNRDINGNGVKPPCQTSTTNLLDVSDLKCCLQHEESSTCTSDKFASNILGGSILSTTGTDPFVVCATLCPDGAHRSTRTCSGTPTEQENFNECIALIDPVDCNPGNDHALPVAIDGSTLYYVKSVAADPCPECDC